MVQDAGVTADLVAPTVELRRAWSRSHEEWGPGGHEDGFGKSAIAADFCHLNRHLYEHVLWFDARSTESPGMSGDLRG
ncbi:hypothetical protein [Mycolicibacterium conceptionense]|uniref:hypothetical protein n=1 Tax=Mycolicibacterium conceptionense TaxID=451644 RepID=UPI000AF996B3|nr:hypothetical protein [Mycolicibacterium conceptionense]